MGFVFANKELNRRLCTKRNLNEIGLEKHIIKIEKLLQTKIIPRQKGVISNKEIQSIIRNKKAITVKFGPNIVHDMLDLVETNH